MQPVPLQHATSPAPTRPYSTDIDRFTADYPEFRHFAIGAGPGARTEVDGRLVGDMITALTSTSSPASSTRAAVAWPVCDGPRPYAAGYPHGGPAEVSPRPAR
jgi:hypothetical protein